MMGDTETDEIMGTNNDTCPVKDPTDSPELVKYMSDIPCYLQHVRIQDIDRERALNIGVVDWASLQNWAYGSRSTRPSSEESSDCYKVKSQDSSRSREMRKLHCSDQLHVGGRLSFSCDEPKGSNAIGRDLWQNLRSSAGPNTENICSSLTTSRRKSTDEAPVQSRGRRSPLRRMLDLLPKPKNRTSSTWTTEAWPVDDQHEVFGADKSFPLSINKGKGSMNSLFRSSVSLLDSLQGEGHMPTRQAFLRLSRKNDAPLLVLSSDDNHVLAATMRKRIVSGKDNSECVYRILSVREVEKKRGVWTNQRSKNKKHDLVSDVVAQLKVSGTKIIRSGSQAHSVVREFVLLGSELIPAAGDGSVNTMFNSELASIIVNITKEEETEGILDDVLKSFVYSGSAQRNSIEEKSTGFRKGSLQFEHNPENPCLSSVVVILPSGVHGRSVGGRPSTLIDRWRSGGTCDCGGWDEGCNITVLNLHDKVQERSSGCAKDCPTTDGSHQIELFVQGGTGEDRHFFSMVDYKEGMYMIEFTKSIDLLQAFAISIATLHSRNTSNHSVLQNPVEAKSFGEHSFAYNTNMAPAKTQGIFPLYVAHHPPPSPIGRA